MSRKPRVPRRSAKSNPLAVTATWTDYQRAMKSRSPWSKFYVGVNEGRFTTLYDGEGLSETLEEEYGPQHPLAVLKSDPSLFKHNFIVSWNEVPFEKGSKTKLGLPSIRTVEDLDERFSGIAGADAITLCPSVFSRGLPRPVDYIKAFFDIVVQMLPTGAWFMMTVLDAPHLASLKLEDQIIDLLLSAKEEPEKANDPVLQSRLRKIAVRDGARYSKEDARVLFSEQTWKSMSAQMTRYWTDVGDLVRRYLTHDEAKYRSSGVNKMLSTWKQKSGRDASLAIAASMNDVYRSIIVEVPVSHFVPNRFQSGVTLVPMTEAISHWMTLCELGEFRVRIDYKQSQKRLASALAQTYGREYLDDFMDLAEEVMGMVEKVLVPSLEKGFPAWQDGVVQRLYGTIWTI